MSSGYEPGQNPDEAPKPNPGGGPYSQQVQHTSVAARVPEAIGRGVVSTAVMVFHTNQEFVIDFLATMVRPPQVVTRLVMSPVTFSQLMRGLRTNLDKYEKQFGKLAPREPVPPQPQPGPGQSTHNAIPGEGEANAGSTADGGPAGTPAAGAVPPEAQVGGVYDTAGGAAGINSSGETRPPVEPGQPVQPQPNRIEDIYDQLKLPDVMLGGVFTNVAMIRHTSEEFCFDFIANFYPRSVVTSRVYMSAGRIPSLLATMSDSFEQFRRKTAGGGAGPQGGAS